MERYEQKVIGNYNVVKICENVNTLIEYYSVSEIPVQEEN
jgi:hypothetical protein